MKENLTNFALGIGVALLVGVLGVIAWWVLLGSPDAQEFCAALIEAIKVLVQ